MAIRQNPRESFPSPIRIPYIKTYQRDACSLIITRSCISHAMGLTDQWFKNQSRPNREFRWLRFYQLFRDFCLADPNPANLLAWRKKKIRDFWVSEKNPTAEFFHLRRIHSWPQKTSFHRWVFFGSSSFEEYRSLSFSLRGREKKKIRLALSGGQLFSNFVLHNFLSVRNSCKNCNNLFVSFFRYAAEHWRHYELIWQLTIDPTKLTKEQTIRKKATILRGEGGKFSPGCTPDNLIKTGGQYGKLYSFVSVYFLKDKIKAA